MTKKLLFSVTKKDLEVQTFCSGGPGGQHQNATQSGVRITHRESGAIGECREQRNQGQNKKIALERLANSQKFKLWLNRKVYEISIGKTIEEKIEEDLQRKNLKVEVRDENNQWEEIND